MAVDEVPHSALIIDSPHIDRILAGEKTWEMRSRNCTKRGLIGLIRKGSGKVVGLAKVIGVRGPLTRSDLLANLDKHRRAREDLDKPALAKNNFAWILSDARPLAQPVSYVHKGGVTWVTLDSDVREKIANQTGLTFIRGMPPLRRITAPKYSRAQSKLSVAGRDSKDVVSDAVGWVTAGILILGLIILIANVGLFPILAILVVIGFVISGGSFISIIRVIPGLMILVFIFYLIAHL